MERFARQPSATLALKVCGLRQTANIEAIAALKPDFMGFIFYERSPRYAGAALDAAFARALRSETRTVGVFVNASAGEAARTLERYDFAAAQLHGDESPADCAALKLRTGALIFKAFNVAEAADFERAREYEDAADALLFDAKTQGFGGGGERFDWSVLNAYKGKLPFFLSGGITLDHAAELRALRHNKLYGADINSRFETEPGVKDAAAVAEFARRLRE